MNLFLISMSESYNSLSLEIKFWFFKSKQARKYSFFLIKFDKIKLNLLYPIVGSTSSPH